MTDETIKIIMIIMAKTLNIDLLIAARLRIPCSDWGGITVTHCQCYFHRNYFISVLSLYRTYLTIHVLELAHVHCFIWLSNSQKKRNATHSAYKNMAICNAHEDEKKKKSNTKRTWKMPIYTFWLIKYALGSHMVSPRRIQLRYAQ